MEILIILLLIAGIVFVFLKLNKKTKEYNQLLAKYKDIIDLEEYKEKIRKESEQIIAEKNQNVLSLEKQIADLRADYSDKRVLFEKLVNEISIYEEQQETMSFGLYKPHFDFDTSEKYKIALLEVKEKEKELIKNESAAMSGTTWTVNGSVAEGKKQTKHYMKLMLRAFNGECDSLVADVRWNNIQKMEERMLKVFEAINKLGETHSIQITDEYLKLKKDELRLTFEYQDKLRLEKEEQKRIQEQIREEERAQKEIEKALKESEDEEKRFNKALEQARKEMDKATGDQLTKLQEKMNQLQKELEESRQLKQRALSMAQQTKAGHVYVISNIGSFGENIFKIGMTRRLEPMDRVKELGDASVPFEFDVHAIIYSENAPELENILHKEFDFHKVNLVNDRKEFFNVSIEEIERIVRKYNASIELTKLAEAREYRESATIRSSREKKEKKENNPILEKVPVSI
ncbi:MAG: DUF4041 domain-containing protein [Leptospiraceae bacterium]|nr:DUF4041 domain-containing protein [Leptospiraceae bacterium]